MDQAERVAAPEEHSEDLMELIRALPEHYGAVVYLFYYEGYSLDEIAKLCAAPQPLPENGLAEAGIC